MHRSDLCNKQFPVDECCSLMSHRGRRGLRGFLLAINYATISGLCIYYTMTGYIFPYGAISEKYIIDNFNGDCEMLCYNNSSCVGANIRATANGSIVCEFRTVPSNDYAFRLAQPETDSKLIVKTEHFLAPDNVSLKSAGAKCSSGHTYYFYTCDLAFDGDSSSAWYYGLIGVSDNSWIQVNLAHEWLVYRLDLIPAKSNSLIRAANINFSDGSHQMFRDLDCYLQRSRPSSEHRSGTNHIR
ncbi:hypothetical protein LSH36_830g00006 [Paralvinella palmiformis]|uniref:Uncharacterized protein n=1 Tax=Paralvinella palmiformis TaxID=53620 RepID=A0AAD9J051_9ANNE|nr:hypothetical protein LSH36_830g00006 [Paralvinella palmiformis]